MLEFYDWLFFFMQKTAYDMRISDWSSDVCSSDVCRGAPAPWRAEVFGCRRVSRRGYGSCRRSAFEVPGRGDQRQPVAQGAEAADHAHGQVAEVALAAERDRKSGVVGKACGSTWRSRGPPDH